MNAETFLSRYTDAAATNNNIVIIIIALIAVSNKSQPIIMSIELIFEIYIIIPPSSDQYQFISTAVKN
jgi:hypothetical protein